MRITRTISWGMILLISAFNAGVSQQVASREQQTASKAGTVTVDMRNAPVRSIINEIARQAGLKVIDSEVGNLLDKKASVKVTNATVIHALAVATSGTGINAQLAASAGAITVTRASIQTRRVGQGVIAGKVTDAKSGKGISGATVAVSSDTRGVMSNEDGSYRLSGIAAGNHIISVRLVGYAKQTRIVTVGEGATVTADFKLEPSANVLDQVIVTGTVVQTELKAVPSAITVVTAKDIEQRGITRIDQLFRGEIPGLLALELGGTSPVSGGASLDEVVMYSRGATNISSSTNANAITNPIKTYIDGVELADAQYLSQIDPKSIERIEILTGPQASTIYGANAINGVMQIFTKRGSTARPSLTFGFLEGIIQNNYSSALTPVHQYDGSIAGSEGKFFYNVGSSWNYSGAWSPGKQLQRTSVYGGGRYQAGVFSLDMSARQGWTANKQDGSTTQAYTALAEEGVFSYINGSTNGLTSPTKRSLSGRTYGTTVQFTPFSWWSHQISLGSDASNTQTLRSSPSLATPSDTSVVNSQEFNSRGSQTYSSTLRVPISQSYQATLTYGADHWRDRRSNVSWTTQTSGTLTSPSVERVKPGKNSGVYVQGQFGLRDVLFLTYGVRADWNPNYGENAKVLPGRYGISYSREVGGMSAKLRGSYGRSIRPPVEGQIQGSLILPTTASNSAALTVFSVPGSPLYIILPSPDLGPEFQQGGEGGIELYFNNRGSIVVTRYNQTVDGLVNQIPNVDSVRALQPGFNPSSGTSACDGATDLRSDGYCYRTQQQNLNVGSIRNQGWEFQGNVNLGPLTTRGTYSWVKSRVIGITPRYRSLLLGSAAAPFTPGTTFNYMAEHTWAINTSYAIRGTAISLNVNGIGPSLRTSSVTGLNFVTSTNLRLRTEEAQRMLSSIEALSLRVPVSGYTVANMNALHRVSSRVEAMLQVSNLTDYYRNDINSVFPAMGRQTNLGVRIRY